MKEQQFQWSANSIQECLLGASLLIKAQGSTYSEMVADMTKPSNVKVIPQGVVYTMLSRGKTSKQVKLINFNPSFIKVNEGALDEMNRMKLHASLKWCHPIEILKEMNVVIFGCLNIWSLESHFKGLEQDPTLKLLNGICLTETHVKGSTEKFS